MGLVWLRHHFNLQKENQMKKIATAALVFVSTLAHAGPQPQEIDKFIAEVDAAKTVKHFENATRFLTAKVIDVQEDEGKFGPTGSYQSTFVGGTNFTCTTHDKKLAMAMKKAKTAGQPVAFRAEVTFVNEYQKDGQRVRVISAYCDKA